jgi:hypothetical protein
LLDALEAPNPVLVAKRRSDLVEGARSRHQRAIGWFVGDSAKARCFSAVAGNKELPADVMAEIVERTDGIPLFVEEMTKAVLEAESEDDLHGALGGAD